MYVFRQSGDVTYSDVGGCKEQIDKLREVVETPLLHVRSEGIAVHVNTRNSVLYGVCIYLAKKSWILQPEINRILTPHWGRDEGIPSECLRFAIHDEACRVMDVANLDMRMGFPSPSLNVVFDYFSHSCLKMCKICLKRTLDATFLDCLALTFYDVIDELIPEWACLTLQGGTTFLLTSKLADIPVSRVRIVDYCDACGAEWLFWPVSAYHKFT